MTNKDLLIQLLCEATGETKAVIRMKMQWVIWAMENEKAGSTAAFHTNFNEEEAEIILDDMRQRRASIVEWFVQLVNRLESS